MISSIKSLEENKLADLSYQYFNDAQITKIKVNSKNDSWCIFINKKDLLPVNIYEELEKLYGKDFDDELEEVIKRKKQQND